MKDVVKVVLEAADDKKASDMVVLDISELASFADYFVILSGDSSRQIHAIVDEVEKKLAEIGVVSIHIEGYRNAEWVLMDYADLVVHVFSRSAREYYDLERLWRDGRRLDAEAMLGARDGRSLPAGKDVFTTDC